MALSTGLMERSIKDSGKMEFSTGKEFLEKQMELKEKEFGIKEILKNGLNKYSEHSFLILST